MNNNKVFSQVFVRVEFSGNQKQVKESKKILGKYDIYFILSDEEIIGTFTNDNLLVIETLTDKQLERIKNQEYILIKLKNRKSCFYSMLSFDFVKSGVIKNLFIYKVPKKKRVLGLFTITLKTKELATQISYSERGLSIIQPITMIPCARYKGEYDNGLVGYRNFLRKQ